MFTGMVEERGSVVSFTRIGTGVSGGRLTVRCRTAREGSPVGASVAVNGVCLTVVERPHDGLSFDVTEETLSRSGLGGLAEGDPVNLERPATLSTRLSGHLVQGHVDGVGTVTSMERQDSSARMAVRTPAGLSRYLVEKGSVALDGVSLTVAEVEDETFTVALIPHTLAVTTLGSAGPGHRVNVEVDVISKYVERLLEGSR